MLALFCTLLTYLLHFLDLIFPLEVSIFNLFDSIFILLLQSFKFIHPQVHNILFGIGISDHHAEVRWELIEVDIAVLAAVRAIHLLMMRLLHACRRVSVRVDILLLEVPQIVHALLQALQQVPAHLLRPSIEGVLALRPVEPWAHAGL